MTRAKVTPRILHLILYREFFDAMVNGEKNEEYREIKPFWTRRLTEERPGEPGFFPRPFVEVTFRNGYNPFAPYMRREWLGLEIKEWRGQQVYAIKLGKILELRDYLTLEQLRAKQRADNNTRVARFAERNPTRRAEQVRRAAKTYYNSVALLEVEDIRNAKAMAITLAAAKGYAGTLRPNHI